MSKDDFDDEKPAAKPGHNSGIDPDYLKNIVKEVEACDAKIDGLKEDRKAFLESAKENGYKYRSMDPTTKAKIRRRLGLIGDDE